jgi:hypothetical protein
MIFMEVMRYEGTRYITEEEIDKEFTGRYVLITFNHDNPYDGFLLASAEDSNEGYAALSGIAVDEYNRKAIISYGCKERGMNLRVELLGWADGESPVSLAEESQQGPI